MNFQDILDRIAAEPPRQPGVQTVPSREIIAFTVRYGRTMRGWKVATLASFAGVSISSIERVERAEMVQPDSLDKIAIALGYSAGAFIAPRYPISLEKVAADFIETYGDLQQVDVEPLATERLLRNLARCDGCLIHRELAGENHDALIEGLRDRLDLTGFILSEEEFGPKPRHRSERGRRELYRSVLAHVAQMNAVGLTVLAGVMHAPQPDITDWRIAVIAVSPRSTDPAAAKRKFMMVDRRCVAFGPLPN
jgi:transcriptional regulator with XRE-family HTH domain